MARKDDNNLVVALDIGTTKISAIVGECDQQSGVNVIGFGTHPSRGLKRGVVVDIESTVNSINRAIEEASLMAGCEIHSVYTGISGSHVRSLNSHGIVAIRDNECNRADVERVIDAAKAVAIPADQRIIHILPQEFRIDDQDGIREPVGMSGVRLEAKVHIVTGAVSAAQNIAKCVRRCGINMGDIVLEQIASSHSVLHPDEKELGVCLIDIGGGTTDLAVFIDGAIRHTAVIPIAGDHVTHDIAMGLRTPLSDSEVAKVNFGSVSADDIPASEIIEVPVVGKRTPRTMPRQVLAKIMEARYEELMILIQSELQRSGFDRLLPAGVVITGGASQVPGIEKLAESVLRMPVRLGNAVNVGGLAEVRENPIFATGVGLLLHAVKSQQHGMVETNFEQRDSLWQRMRNWFNGNF
jgi:cell division protein FtsA